MDDYHRLTKVNEAVVYARRRLDAQQKQVGRAAALAEDLREDAAQRRLRKLRTCDDRPLVPNFDSVYERWSETEADGESSHAIAARGICKLLSLLRAVVFRFQLNYIFSSFLAEALPRSVATEQRFCA